MQPLLSLFHFYSPESAGAPFLFPSSSEDFKQFRTRSETFIYIYISSSLNLRGRVCKVLKSRPEDGVPNSASIAFQGYFRRMSTGSADSALSGCGIEGLAPALDDGALVFPLMPFTGPGYSSSPCLGASLPI